MSGRKCSQWRLSSAVEERQAAAGEVASRLVEIERLRARIAEVMAGAAPAVRAAAGDAAARGDGWLAEAAGLAGLRGVENETVEALRQRSASLAIVLREGEAVRIAVEEDFRRRPERLRSTLGTRLEAASAGVRAQEESLRRWLGAGGWNEILSGAQTVRSALEADDFAKAEEGIRAFEGSAREAMEEAGRREAAHLREESERELARARSAVEEAAAVVSGLRGGASRGLQECFPDEIERAAAWERRAADALREAASARELDAAREAVSGLEARAREGGKLAAELQEVLGERAARLREGAAAAVEAAESALLAGAGLVRTWHGAGEAGELERRLEELRHYLCDDRLVGLEEAARKAEALVRERVEAARTQDAKDKRRLYLLKALRKVCSDLGFDEVGTPARVPPGDPRGRIKITFDTHNQGTVIFCLSLERIDADACGSSGHCEADFASLSRKLKAQFGVIAPFTWPDGRPIEKLKAQDAKREPWEDARTVT